MRSKVRSREVRERSNINRMFYVSLIMNNLYKEREGEARSLFSATLTFKWYNDFKGNKVPGKDDVDWRDLFSSPPLSLFLSISIYLSTSVTLIPSHLFFFSPMPSFLPFPNHTFFTTFSYFLKSKRTNVKVKG